MDIASRTLISLTAWSTTLLASGICQAQAAGGEAPAAPAEAAAAPTPTPEAAPSVQATPEAPSPSEPAPTQSVASQPAPVAFAPVESTPPEAAVPAEPPADEGPSVPSYFRIDHDYLFGLQLWAGATYSLSDSVGLATDIYVAENFPSGSITDGVSLLSWWGEFDVGPSFAFGPVSLTPMVGIAFDWAAKKAVAINGPQLYTIVNAGPVYFESWVWTLLYSAFDKDGANDYIHTRHWLLYKVTDAVGIGPQLEYTYDIEDRSALAFPLGGHLELAYGTGNSLGLFLGYEVDKDVREAADGAGAEGRLTFVHNF